VSVTVPPEDLPTAILAEASRPIRWRGVAQLVLWGIVALPALYQIGLLIEAIAWRRVQVLPAPESSGVVTRTGPDVSSFAAFC